MNNNNGNDHVSSASGFRRRREALGLTRAQLAVEARCSLTSISNIEAGVTRRGITRDKLDRILASLEQAPDQEAA